MGTKRADDPTRSSALSFYLPWGLWSLPDLHHSWWKQETLMEGGKAWECFLKEHLGRRAWAGA